MPSPLDFFGPEDYSGGLSFSEIIDQYGVNNPLIEREAALRGIQFEYADGTMYAGGSRYFDERAGDYNAGPAYDTSMINMYLGDDPRPTSDLTWDGYSKGPESLLWLQGRIPDRNGNYHNPQQPLGAQKQFPNEAQLQREYQEYRNSIGNPPTIANDYFYWRADRLAGASAVPAGNKSIFSLGPESFIQMDAITEFQARQPKDVRLAGEGMLLSPHDLQNSKITAMAYQLAGITQVSGGRLSPEAEQKVSAGMQQALLLIQQKMAGGQSYDEAVESVYADQGAPSPAPRRGGGGDEPFKCATGCSSWHEKQCKKYGAPRGCDLDKAKKNHRDRNRTTYCPVPSD